MYQEQLVFSLKNGDTLTVTNANIWQGSLEFEQAVSSEGSFELGATHIGQMTVSLADLPSSRIENAVFSLNSDGHLMLNGNRVTYQSVYTNVDFVDATIVLSMAKDSDTLQQIGVYTVVKCTRDNGVINLTAYDNMNKLSEAYTTNLTFPTTYGAMANEICNASLTFDGSTTAVQERPTGDNLTKREVLGYIAQACGYNVLCDNLGRFQFVRYNLSGFNTEGQYHAISSLYSFHHSQYPVVVTGAKVVIRSIVTTTDPDTGEETSEEVVNTYTAGTDDYQIVIEDNPLITAANGQAVADLIFATYGGVSFYTGTVSHVSDLSIKASDIMKVTDRTGTSYNMLVSSTKFSTGSAQSTGSYAEEPASKLSVQPTELSRVQTAVKQALLDAKNGQNKANYASRIASNTNQYFWHTETGSDTGAHITEIPQEEFLADPENGGGNLLARSNGVAIRNGLNELAQFTSNMVLFNDEDGNCVSSFGTSGTRIGKTGNANLELNNLGFVGFDENNYEVFRLQFANASGVAEITEHGESIVNTNVDMQTFQDFTAYLSNTPVQNTQIYHVIHAFINFDGRDATCHLRTTPRTYNRESSSSRQTVPYRIEVISGNNIAYLSLSERYVEFSPDSSFVNIATSHSAVKILVIQVDTVLSVDASTVPSYTFGTRTDARTRYGGYSFTSGRNNSATGNDAVAMGKDNVASGEWSHVVGQGNTASGMWSYAGGSGCIASGVRSHAEGGDTTASSTDQFVIGRRNIDDPNDQYAFIIGNGDYAEETNSNALTVDWDGNVAMSGDLTASNVGTVYSNTANAIISSTNIDTYAVGASVTVPAGVYVITAYWTFPGVSGAKICDVDISTTDSTTTTGYIARQRVSNATGNWSRLNVTTIESFAAQTTLYVKGSSNVAYTAAAATRIMAVRIK